MDKRQRFRNSDFGGRSSHLGERPPHMILEKLVIRRSFFSSGQTTSPIYAGEVLDSAVVLQDWANDRPT